jgi:hypothetical protein
VVTCPSTNSISLTFSYLSPATRKGTIVLFIGGGGELTQDDTNMYTASDYYAAGYAVVQTSWGWDWEDANGGPGAGPASYPYSILTAACRPATFLNYINNPANGFHSAGAMCAHGASAGSGAVVYAIVWYGIGSILNNVELNAGPVFGDVEIGCQYPLVGNVNICANNQTGCSPGTLTEVQLPPTGTGAWEDAPQYISNYLASVQGWTGNLSPACNNGTTSTGGVSPLTGNNLIWKQQSIVTGTGNGAFSWPSNLQGVGGWACYSYQTNTCNNQSCPDNAAAEGQQFYLAVNAAGLPPGGYLWTGMQNCYGAENTGQGIDPDNGEGGQAAIEDHMEKYCTVPH